MKYRRYPQYKESGVEWLGEVPAHWIVLSLGKVTKLQRGHDLPEAERIDGIYPVITSSGPSGYHNDFRAEAPGVVTGRYGTIGQIYYIEQRYWPLNTSLYSIDLFGNHPRFIYYMLMNLPFDMYSDKSAVPGVNRNDLHTLGVARPALDEQQAITVFLDSETAQIDALIAKQERLIAALQEKRQALISHAVTKGLDPAAPMKDSGVEWLGPVPAHWKVVQLRRLLVTIEQGQTLDSENRLAEVDEWAVLKSGCVNGGVFRPEEHKALTANAAFAPADEVRTGDILMSRASGSIELVGSVALVGDVRSRLLLSDKTFRLVPSADILPAFLAIQLNTRHLRGQIQLLANGAEGLPNNITKPSINSLLVTAPPVEEQQEIVSSLAHSLAQIECVAARSGAMIALLRERRAALIAAAVTGKIDVRG